MDKTPDQTLAEWKSRAERAIYAHRFASKGFQSSHLWLGIPLVILTAFVGTSVFATLEKEASITLRIITGGNSVLAAILAALQTFLGFRERSQKHSQAAVGFAAARRKIEQYQSFPSEQRGDIKEFFDSIRSELDTLASLPEIPERYWKKTDKAIQENRQGRAKELSK